jgi:hypothetical protein
MMKRLRIALVFLLPAVLTACGGRTPFECFESTGPEQAEEVDLAAFTKVVAYDNIDLHLMNGTGQKVVVNAGADLLPKIELNVTDGVLTVRNKNSCGWSRTMRNPVINIYSESLKRVEIYGYSNVTTPDTLNVKSFSFYTYGTGDFNLAVSGDSLFIESEFISNFRVKGNVNYLFVHFTNDSQFHGKDLIARDVIISHYGSNAVEVFPVDLLKGNLVSTGNLYYFNKPSEINIKIYSSGKLVPEF